VETPVVTSDATGSSNLLIYGIVAVVAAALILG